MSGHPSHLGVLILLIMKMNGCVRAASERGASPICAGLLGTITRLTRKNVAGRNAAV